MPFTPFNFTKSWRNAVDFPTFESDETKVRDDMQSLFDELKTGLNRLMSELRAGNVPFTPTAEIDSSNVQNAIENVQSQIAGIATGDLPPGSVSAEKLATDAVTTEKIEDGAITSDKIAPDALPAAGDANPSAPGVASPGESASYARADHVHPKDSTKADLSGGKVLATQLSKAKLNVTASRNLALSDDNKLLYVNTTGGVTITIPLNSVVQFPIGSEVLIYRAGSGAVTIAAASGVTMYSSSPAYNALKRYDYAVLRKLETNVWAVDFTHELANGSVGTNQLADLSVTNGKLANGSVGASKLADESVTTSKVSSKAVTRDKLAADVLYSPIKEITGTSYTILADDLGKTLKFTSSSNVSVSFPGNLFSSLANGAEFAILKWASNDTSKVTVSVDSSHYIARSGTTVQGGSASISSRYSMAALKKVTAATLLVTGELD